MPPAIAQDSRANGVVSAIDLIGKTPLIRLNRLPKALGIHCDVYVKAEFFNPGGSIKDRVARRMIEEAEKSGRIKPGDTLIEPTSGNTGIGLALIGALKGYKIIITLPEKMSREKVTVLRALGAKIIRTPTDAPWDSPESHIGVARRLQRELPNAHILDQYGNINNPLTHELETAEEIWQQTGGNLNAIVAGAGTGGTITGLAKGLKKHNPEIKVIGVDPPGSILAFPDSLNMAQEHQSSQIEGIGGAFIPDVLDRGLVDKWYKTDDRHAFHLARRLISEEGLLVGGSSGAAMAAMMLAVRDFGFKEGDAVVVVMPDGIRNYLSKFADDDWLEANDLLPVGDGDDSIFAGTSSSPVTSELDGESKVQSSRRQFGRPIEVVASCRDALQARNEMALGQAGHGFDIA